MGLNIQAVENFTKALKKESVLLTQKQNFKSINPSELTFIKPSQQVIGKHKIPRYLYHLTSKSCYESMLKDGKIIASEELIGKGVFMAELSNLFKRWGVREAWSFGGKTNLKEKLLQQAAKGEDEIVALRIPTANIDRSKLRIRGQEKLFTWDPSNHSALSKATSLEEARQIGTNIKEYSHIFYGDTAKNSKLYKQRKESIEYIFPGDINMSNVEKIGEVNVANLRQTKEYDVLRPMRSIYSKLFRGKPEEKAALLLNT